MSGLPYETIRSALDAQPLFEDKTWRLAPDLWPLTSEQIGELERIGPACLEFHQALETLYLRSATGRNLLRNRPLLAPWAAEYLDRGKPPELIAHAREPRNRGAFPPVLRPDLLLTDEGFVMSELDAVPGGIGLTAFLNRLYSGETTNSKSHIADGVRILGEEDAMIDHFHASLRRLRPDQSDPLIAIVVSDEAATYRPAMEWLSAQLQLKGHRVHCLRPAEVFPLGDGLCFDADGNPEKIDIIYRFFELFDLPNLRTARHDFEAWSSGEVAIAPPMRPMQEEKLTFALFHHHLLQEFWTENLSRNALRILRGLIPPTWVIDPAPLPPGAVLDGPKAAGRALNDWRDLASATQKERDYVIKISGYHETAWGARGLALGSDSSREEWSAAVERAVTMAPSHLHVLQAYRKPRRVEHTLYASPTAARNTTGRLRLCPYYFIIDGTCRLSGALATFCPPDKKIIHGMQDAALLPVGVFP